MASLAVHVSVIPTIHQRRQLAAAILTHRRPAAAQCHATACPRVVCVRWTPPRVEARALVRGLCLARESGFIERLLVEGDDVTLVRLLRGESRQTRVSSNMEEHILELLDRFRGGCEV